MKRLASLVPLAALLLGCDQAVTDPTVPDVFLGVDGWAQGKIAWAKEFPGAEGGVDIAIQNSDGTGFRQLTDHPAADDQPAVSPDRRWVLFRSNRFAGKTFIYVTRSDGFPGSETRITTGLAREEHPTWSPDGTMFAFLRQMPSPNNTMQLFIQKFSGGTAVQVTFGNRSIETPVWSPDGGRIAYVKSTTGPTGVTNHKSVFVMKLATGQSVQVADSTYWNIQPAWSPDGLWIAYATTEFRGSTLDIAKVPHSGGAGIRVTTGAWEYLHPTWSPDGSMIAMHAGHPIMSIAVYDIRRVPAGGGSDVLLPNNNGPTHDREPDWR